MKFHPLAMLRANTIRLLATCLFLGAGAAAHAGKSNTYGYSHLGNPNAAVTAKPVSSAPSIVLKGGGYDVGEAFRWMIQQAGVAPGTGGRFLVIRATGSNGYNAYIYSHAGTVDTTTPMGYENVGGITLGLSSAETLVIPSRTAAGDPFVLDTVSKASAIWIAGGNQADYYKHWKGTALETALREAIHRNIPVGGTSAGAAILGEYGFAALNGSVTSSQALSDPFNKYVTIDPLNTGPKGSAARSSFLNVPALASAITDTHLNTRDRLGRLVTFVARIGKGVCAGGIESYSSVRGIGLDEETALLISADSSGHAVAKLAVNPFNAENFSQSNYHRANSAYHVANNTLPSVCAAGVPLGFNNGAIELRRLSDLTNTAPSGVAPNTSYQTGGWIDIGTGAGEHVSIPYYYGAGRGVLEGPTPY